MAFIVALVVVLVDQVTKLLTLKFLKGQSPHPLIPGFAELTYVENRGAAFGTLDGKKYILIAIMVAAIIGISYLLITKKYSWIIKVGLALILGGAIGNLIDRLRIGYVVDMIGLGSGGKYWFPVFNIADIAITFGTIFIIYALVYGKEYPNGSSGK